PAVSAPGAAGAPPGPGSAGTPPTPGSAGTAPGPDVGVVAIARSLPEVAAVDLLQAVAPQVKPLQPVAGVHQRGGQVGARVALRPHQEQVALAFDLAHARDRPDRGDGPVVERRAAHLQERLIAEDLPGQGVDRTAGDQPPPDEDPHPVAD